MRRIPWELVWERDPGFRTETAASGVNLRLNWLLSHHSRGVRNAYGENDRLWSEGRRLVALDGLRLAVDLLAPGRTRLLYTAAHTPTDDRIAVRSQAFAMSELSVGDLRRGDHPNAAIHPGQLRQIEWSVAGASPGEELRLADDVHNTGVIAELNPAWSCSPDVTGRCVMALDLQQALLPQSWERLARKLDLSGLV
ncbi:MAG TPA: hypothetical protein VLI54_03075 [Bacillota bacterium]|nr:hypothetical protein [Bacillota bacterium]